jgi:hypothetical protein
MSANAGPLRCRWLRYAPWKSFSISSRSRGRPRVLSGAAVQGFTALRRHFRVRRPDSFEKAISLARPHGRGRTLRPARPPSTPAAASSPRPRTPACPRRAAACPASRAQQLAGRLLQLADVTQVGQRRNDPSVDGARTVSNALPIPPCRSTSRSSIESAPAAIPATTEQTFAAALARTGRWVPRLSDRSRCGPELVGSVEPWEPGVWL